MTFKNNKTHYLSESFVGLDFSGLVISAKEFDDCTFKDCNFSETVFKRCQFTDCEFSQCNLSVAVMKYSAFSESTFIGCKLIGIDWTKANWSKLTLSSPIKFYQCILNESSFFGLELQDIVLKECQAKNIDFREGDFRKGHFASTDLSGCLFGNTNLTGADFTDAINYDIDITRNNIKKAKFSRYEALRLLQNLQIELVD